MYRFSLLSFEWMDMSIDVHGSAPSNRSYLGFTSLDKDLFLFGGWNGNGT